MQAHSLICIPFRKELYLLRHLDISRMLQIREEIYFNRGNVFNV
jgi:hypothetical protein